ncbi:MAG: tRNA pseudouridine(55) synthase TruB [Piscirickettsiaceae bacterium]|nr:tRNA pseudouridine(55) synthase TruB [Piscirickettsiaceae bacterium]
MTKEFNEKSRDIAGIVIVDKSTGQSSNCVLQQVKRIFCASKAGHTGSLDPLATGLLPICLGEATKISSYLLGADKRYYVTCQLGVITDSGDSDGKIIKINYNYKFNETNLLSVLTKFIGNLNQVPPMYSALKHQGQPLYRLARRGIRVRRKSRKITIYNITLLECTADMFTLDVICSKGTYIRTLIEDISNDLGCGGHVIMLRRVEINGYSAKQSLSIEQLYLIAQRYGIAGLDICLLSVEDVLPDWPKIDVSDDMVESLRFGQIVQVQHEFERANVCLFDQYKRFLGLGKMSESGFVAPKRIFSLPIG